MTTERLLGLEWSDVFVVEHLCDVVSSSVCEAELSQLDRDPQRSTVIVRVQESHRITVLW